MYLRYLNFRKNAKKLGKYTRNLPLLHKLLANTFNFYIIYVLPILNLYKKLNFNKTKDISKVLGLQSIRLIKLKNIDLSSRDNLIKSINNKEFKEGGWCIYYKNAFEILDPKLFLDSYKDKSLGIKIVINDKIISSDNRNEI